MKLTKNQRRAAWIAGAFFAYMIVTDPTNAAALADHFFGWVGTIATGVSDFVSNFAN